MSRTKQRERLMGMLLYTALYGFGRICVWSLESSYIYASAWGFQRCSFRHTGQCEGLLNVERVTDWLRASFVYVPYKNQDSFGASVNMN